MKSQWSCDKGADEFFSDAVGKSFSEAFITEL